MCLGKVSDSGFNTQPEAKHLKLILEAGKNKWPALYWGAAEKAHNKEFTIDDKIDVVFNLSRDYYKGNEIPQMLVMDIKKSDN